MSDTFEDGQISDVDVDSDNGEMRDNGDAKDNGNGDTKGATNDDGQQPQAYKKRGRPSSKDVIEKLRIQLADLTKYRDNYKALEDKFSELKSANSELKEMNAATFSELEELKLVNSDLETEKMELLEQLANEGDNSVSEPKPLGLFFHDGLMRDLYGKLPRGINWDEHCVNLMDLDPKTVTTHAEKSDVILFSIGTADIKCGTKGLEAASKLVKIANDISHLTQVVITTIPPTATKGNSSQISLFNFKLNKSQAQFQLISAEFTKQSLDENDEPTDKAIDMVASSINSQLKTPVAKKPQAAESTEKGYETQVLMEIQQRDIGKIIGKSGFTIAKLTNDHKVKMTIGKWCEPRKDNRDELTEIMDAVLIKGNSAQVREVMAKIDNIISEPAQKRTKRQ